MQMNHSMNELNNSYRKMFEIRPSKLVMANRTWKICIQLVSISHNFNFEGLIPAI